MYFVIRHSDRDVYVEYYKSAEALVESLEKHYEGVKEEHLPKFLQDLESLQYAGSEVLYWNDKELVIKGEIVAPTTKPAKHVWEVS